MPRHARIPRVRGCFLPSRGSYLQRMSLAVSWAQEMIRARVPPGGIAVDATAGNGHDTLFLARHLGESGRVYAFDTQEQAVEATRRRMAEAGRGAASVVCVRLGHEQAPAWLAEKECAPLAAVMFNLGYLPGGDKSLITQPATTCAALAGMAPLLAAGGLLTVVMYPGHAGGGGERDAVLVWARGLPREHFAASHHAALNAGAGRPELLAVERRRG